MCKGVCLKANGNNMYISKNKNLQPEIKNV